MGRDGKERICFTIPGAGSVPVLQQAAQKQQAKMAGRPGRAGLQGQQQQQKKAAPGWAMAVGAATLLLQSQE